MKILVGLSGGVDSSVALIMLKKAGHEVAGATMSLWSEGKYRGGDRDACFGPNEKTDIAYAQKLCAELGVPHYLFDCSDIYEASILEDFRREYLAGRTPNPCVRCNARMKFGALPELARKSGVEFDLFATGHYARTERVKEQTKLLRAKDLSKDQSYFLYRLTPRQLALAAFPLGAMTKTEVRKLAVEFGLEVSGKPDSQDFYSGDTFELLNAPPREGAIVDEFGKRLGSHSGYWRYTIGQRKGLGIAAATPLYVVKINACRNEVVVSPRCPNHHHLSARELNWLEEAPFPEPFEAEVKVRSSQIPVKCVATVADGGVQAEIPEGIFAISPGQSAVFYRGDEVLGGGIISEARE